MIWLGLSGLVLGFVWFSSVCLLHPGLTKSCLGCAWAAWLGLVWADLVIVWSDLLELSRLPDLKANLSSFSGLNGPDSLLSGLFWFVLHSIFWCCMVRHRVGFQLGLPWVRRTVGMAIFAQHIWWQIYFILHVLSTAGAASPWIEHDHLIDLVLPLRSCVCDLLCSFIRHVFTAFSLKPWCFPVLS